MSWRSHLKQWQQQPQRQECVEAIKKYAFVASPYPVIITLENRAGRDTQVRTLPEHYELLDLKELVE
jgi:hypothetical protein